MATNSTQESLYGTGFSPDRGNSALGTIPLPFVTVTTLPAGATQTVTAAAMIGGLVLHDPTTGTTDTLDTAANILAAMPGAAIGQSFQFDFVNIADGNETITVAAGTGGATFAYSPATGTYTIAQNNGKRFLVVITGMTDPVSGAGTPAYTLYSLGTYVF